MQNALASSRPHSTRWLRCSTLQIPTTIEGVHAREQSCDCMAHSNTKPYSTGTLPQSQLLSQPPLCPSHPLCQAPSQTCLDATASRHSLSSPSAPSPLATDSAPPTALPQYECVDTLPLTTLSLH